MQSRKAAKNSGLSGFSWKRSRWIAKSSRQADRFDNPLAAFQFKLSIAEYEGG
ncbi:MAG: hypothetical protein HY870_20130 [Chloroflexi bacterium]|nr:hypothetical protein [Chloroflexota bacterium]